MPVATTNEEFLETLRKSQLVESERLDSFLRHAGDELPAEPRLLAESLVRQGLLTPFQAGQVLSGKHKGFLVAGGKYRLLQLLGIGGMGKVYLCEHVRMRRLVALKVLPVEQTKDESSVARFNREAQAAAALNHPNIVRAHDIDQDGSLHFLVMEFVDGTSLQDLVKKFGPLSVERACHYITQSAIGLQHAHEAGWVHRDIKPGNLLLDRTGTVKILDMGLARFFQESAGESLTQKFDKSAVLGTADYLAPEQAVNSTDVDIRADIYSLGATLYFLLTGQSPFEQGTVAEKLLAHQMKEPTPITQLRPDLPKALESVVRKMMAKKPVHRFQTPLAVVEALHEWVEAPIEPPADEEMPRLSPAVEPLVTGVSQPASGISHISGRHRIPRSGILTSGYLLRNGVPSGRHFGIMGRTPNWFWAVTGAAAMSCIIIVVALWKMYLNSDPPQAKPETKPEPNESVARAPATTVPAVAESPAALTIPGSTLVVSRNPKPDFASRGVVRRSLPEAIAAAAPGVKILLMDEVVEAAVQLSDGARLANVSIESGLTRPVVWRHAPGHASDVPLLEIKSVPGVRVCNVNFNAHMQADVLIRATGGCAGLHLDNLVLTEFRRSALELTNIEPLASPIRVEKVRFVTLPDYSASTREKSKDVRNSALVLSTTAVNGPVLTLKDCRVEGMYQSAVEFNGPVNADISRNRFFTLRDDERPAMNQQCNAVMIRQRLPSDKIDLRLSSNTVARYSDLVRIDKSPTPSSTIEARNNLMVGGTAWVIGPPADESALFGDSAGNVCRPNTCKQGYTSFPHKTVDFKYLEVSLDDSKFLKYPRQIKDGDGARDHELLRAGSNGEPVGYPPG